MLYLGAFEYFISKFAVLGEQEVGYLFGGWVCHFGSHRIFWFVHKDLLPIQEWKGQR